MVKKAKKTVRKSASKKMIVLPKKLSSLIGIALKDIRKVEALSNKYVIDMRVWYDPDRELVCKLGDGEHAKVVSRNKVCVLCAAGSVLAFSLGAGGVEKTAAINELEKKNSDQLEAIDYLRQGDAGCAAGALYLSEKVQDKADDLSVNIPEYEVSNPEPFHSAMKAFQTKLAKAGL